MVHQTILWCSAVLEGRYQDLGPILKVAVLEPGTRHAVFSAPTLKYLMEILKSCSTSKTRSSNTAWIGTFHKLAVHIPDRGRRTLAFSTTWADSYSALLMVVACTRQIRVSCWLARHDPNTTSCPVCLLVFRPKCRFGNHLNLGSALCGESRELYHGCGRAVRLS